MSALGETSFPVPKTYLFCEDKTIMGEEFYVMEYIKVFPHRIMVIFLVKLLLILYRVNGGKNVLIYWFSGQKSKSTLSP